MRNENNENKEKMLFSYENKKRKCETMFIEKRERVILLFLLILIPTPIDDFPEKCVLSDKKEKLVLPFSHFNNLFLSTL